MAKKNLILKIGFLVTKFLKKSKIYLKSPDRTLSFSWVAKNVEGCLNFVIFILSL